MAEDMFRAPVNRLMRRLDRSFFEKIVHLQGARIFDNKNINKVRTQLERSKDLLLQPRVPPILPDPDPERAKDGKRCVVLRLESNAVDDRPVESSDTDESRESWPYSPVLSELVDQGLIEIIPIDLHLGYKDWTYQDIITAILPEDEQGEVPSGFAAVGHVAHLNLRAEYLKYKHLIAEILMDKNAKIRTVINKLDDVGEENEYRTFNYEVLAGPDDMDVTVSEEGCIFKFDYSKVYWNSRLSTEHGRMIAFFKEGEAVCDVMAGIGPFAVPAGKKRVFVWANDLNPESYVFLKEAVKINKVHKYVGVFNEDGRDFIRTSSHRLLQNDYKVDVTTTVARSNPTRQVKLLKTSHEPKTFQHYVMNLPAIALTFLPSFIGLYGPDQMELLPPNTQMPLIHVYCFSTKSDDNVREGIEICEEISKQLKHEMKPGKIEDGDVEIHDVRDVAPKKRMFCASFRLPESVAFRVD